MEYLYVMQCNKIHQKQQKSGFKIKKFKNTDLWYQGSYELDFLEKYFDKYPDIKRGPSIKYSFKGKAKYYFPDFYIPFLNLVVECKNSYLKKRDAAQIKAKEMATKKLSFNYILIVDKQYNNFNHKYFLNVSK